MQEQKLSLKCLQDNFGDKTKCEPEVENYKDCKTFWVGFHHYTLFQLRVQRAAGENACVLTPGIGTVSSTRPPIYRSHHMAVILPPTIQMFGYQIL